MARALAFRQPEPIAAINITPLIDVMLVLLIMMILTIPAMTHKIPVDLPTGPAGKQVEPHRLDITASGALLWDGRAIADRQLPGLLDGARMETEKAVLHLRTDPTAKYDRFANTLATVKRSGIESLGFIGNGPLTD